MTSTTGCSVLIGQPADEAVEQLAAELEKHTLVNVPLTADSDRDRYDRAISGVASLPVRVEVVDVTTADRRATATLAWAWDLPGASWEYTTTAELADAAGIWEVDWKPDLVAPDLNSGERLDYDLVTGERGDILGAGGAPLVTKRNVIRFGLDKSQVRPARWRRSAARIARALDVAPSPFRARVEAYGDKAFVEALVLRAEARDQVDATFADIPGAVAIEDQIPLAPTREFAAGVLGSVGEATSEIIQESDGAVQTGDQVGLSGLQARYDQWLRGTPGVRVLAIDGLGEARVLFRHGGRDGRHLSTTLDPELQQRAEDALSTLGTEGPHSALVAIRPSTGEVLAAANGEANQGFNAATTGQYAPGSTFKVVTALALLRAGLSADDVIRCTTTTVADGRTFKNYDDFPPSGIGRVTLTDVVADSCNTALIAERDRLTDDDLTDAAAALGMGVDHHLGFPAYFGQVPRPNAETEKAAATIGQGKVLASPLTMATVAASVSAGRAVLPVLLPDHRVAQTPVARPLEAPESEALRSMMRAVVTRGSATFLADLPGEIGAKTGTAEYGDPAADGSLKTHAWMIAIRDDLAVAVFVGTGDSGSQTAGPILERFLS
jgi:cell division protein FtsI/penicillin-binding protein 2